MSSKEIMTQIESQGNMPDYKKAITKSYDDKVLRPIVQEGADLRSQYLSSVFQPFTEWGTGAADMSPAAKLAAVGSSVGRLSGAIGANQDIQNFYGTQIDNLANTYTNSWRDNMANMWQRYNASAQREEADRQYNLQLQQLAASRAARAAAQQSAPQFPEFPGAGGGLSQDVQNKVGQVLKDVSYQLSPEVNAGREAYNVLDKQLSSLGFGQDQIGQYWNELVNLKGKLWQPG